MCDKNIIVLQDIDFATVSDEFNWVSNVSTEIETISGQLRLIPEDSTSFFRRGLGTVDPANNRVKLKMNLDLFRPQTSLDTKMTVVFGIYVGAGLLDTFTIYQEGMNSGERITHSIERDYKYDALAGNVSLRISLAEGFGNQLFLDYLKSDNFFFCQDDIRTYFIIDELFEKSFASVSSGIKLLEWKINNAETLTTEFFTEIINTGGNPLTDWKFSKSEIDGTQRIAETTTPNSFNPFISEWGLLFDEIGSFHGGKPTGTFSGSNYGNGIMTLGFEKPVIVNGDLLGKKGAFFIDIDYTKNLKVVFDVLVNNTNSNVFDSPYTYRKYFIVWDAVNCLSSFYYTDQLASNPLLKVPMDKDGFLYGITEGVSNQNAVTCTDSFTYSGNAGTFVFEMDFGTDIGEAGINYNSIDIPNKFEIEWNEQIISSGYVGSNAYDQQLLNLGISPTEINTGNPPTSIGVLNFIKSLAEPTTAIIRVTSPLDGTSWEMSGICAIPIESGDFTQITWNDTNTVEDRNGTDTEQTISYNGDFYSVTDKKWERFDGVSWTEVEDLTGTTKTFDIDLYTNKFRLKALNDELEIVYSNALSYNRVNLPSYYSYQMSNVGRESAEMACASTSFTFIMYTNVNVLEIGVRMFVNSTLTTRVGGADLWFNFGIDGISYRIDNDGYITEIVNC